MGQWVGPGINDVDSYQLPGVPVITSVANTTTTVFRYKLVTTQIIFSVPTGATATLDFQDTGGPTTMTLPAGLHTFNVRTDRLRLTANGDTVNICALLSPVEHKHFTPLTQADLLYKA